MPSAHFLPPHLSRPLLLLLSGVLITSDKQPSVLSDKRGSKALACLRPLGLGGRPGWEPGGSRCTHSTRQARSRLEQSLYLLWASVSPSVKGGVWLGISSRALPAGKALTCLNGGPEGLSELPASSPQDPRGPGYTWTWGPFASDTRRTQMRVCELSLSVMSKSLRPHGLQHARLPCTSLFPGVCSNSCPSSR